VDAPVDPGRLALVEARRHVGYHESPPGSNRTAFGRWFGLDGVPWCAIFVSYCFAVGAGLVLGGGRSYTRGIASVPDLERWLRETDQWLAAGPRAGDVVLFDWDGGAPDHVGLVERVEGAELATIEGNTAIGNDSDGGSVLRRRRPPAGIVGYGRLRPGPESATL
jgi:CHAP domain